MGRSTPAPVPLCRGVPVLLNIPNKVNALLRWVTDNSQKGPPGSTLLHRPTHDDEQTSPHSAELIPAGRRYGWSSRAKEAQLNLYRTFPLHQFHQGGTESIGSRWPGGWAGGWTCSDQMTVRTTELGLGKDSWVHQDLRTYFDLCRTRTEERVDGEGVTAAFYKARVCSGDGLRPNSNCSVQRAIGDYTQARTESNWEITHPKSVVRGEVLHSRTRNREKGNSGYEVLRWNWVDCSATEVRSAVNKQDPSAIYRPTTGFRWNSRIADVLASLPCGGFRWGHGGRRLTGACHLSNSLTRRRELLPWPPTTYPSHGGIFIAGETDPYLLPRCIVPWPASSDSLSVHV